MEKLWSQLQQNVTFVVVSAAIAVGLYLVALGLEKLAGKDHRRKITPARRITILAVCAAIATVLHIFDFPLPFLAPGFYKVDFSELPVLLCGFYLGPTGAVGCEMLKILLKLLLKGTSTAFVGDFANFVVGCALVIPATAVYFAKRSRKSALIGLAIGCVVMTVFGSLFNGIYLLPKFSQLFGLPLDKIVAMGGAINPAVSSVTTLVVLAVAPLNLLKSVTVSVLTMLLYKRVARPLFGIKS